MRRSFFSCALVLTIAACGSNPPPPSTSGPSPAVLSSGPATKTSPAGAKELQYSVVVLSRPAGGSVTKVKPDGSRESAFAFIENGRGPKVEVKMRSDASGVLTAFVADGVETMGTPVKVHFVMEGGAHAKWPNQANERGEEDAKGAFYVPMAPYHET